MIYLAKAPNVRVKALFRDILYALNPILRRAKGKLGRPCGRPLPYFPTFLLELVALRVARRASSR